MGSRRVAAAVYEAPLRGVWVSPIQLIFGQNIPYPVNSFGSYPYNASYHDDVIESDIFGYLITTNIFSWGVPRCFADLFPRRSVIARLSCCFVSRGSCGSMLLEFLFHRPYWCYQSEVLCELLLWPTCAVMRIAINKLNFVPEWLMSGVVVVLWNGGRLGMG